MTNNYNFYTDTIPSNLVDAAQWVNWRAEPDPNRPGKIRKVPINARNGRNAQSTNPATWSTFETAVKRAGAGDVGIGFCLDPDRLSLIAVDIDHCIVDGRLAPAAWDMVRMCGSYTEVTPSGEGLRIIMRGLLPAALVRHDLNIEIYESGRYITVTGDALSAAPGDINLAPAAFYAWYDAHRRRPQERPQPAQERRQAPLQLDDVELIERAQAAKNGAKFTQLWSGDGGEYPSASEADFALAMHLAFWTGNDAGRVARLLCQSGLHRPKFDAVHSSTGETYAQLTARNACELNATTYDPDHAAPPPPPEPDPDPGWATGPTPAPVAPTWSPAPRPAPRLTRPGPIAASVATAVLNEVDAVDFDNEFMARYRDKSLADNLWPGRKTVMVASEGYFFGEYPPAQHNHTCNVHLEFTGGDDGEVAYKLWTGRNWRARKIGELHIEACPGCQHDYAWRMAKQIEWEVAEYFVDANPYRYAIVPTVELTKLIDAGRKARERHGIDFRYYARPLADGKTAIVHNLCATEHAPARVHLYENHKLPRARADLFALTLAWTVGASARRAQAVTAEGDAPAWGGEFAKTRGDSGTAEGAPTKKQPQVKIVCKWTDGHSALSALATSDSAAAGRASVHIVDIVRYFEAHNIPYGVASGGALLVDLMNCHELRTYNPRKNDMYVSRDNVFLQTNTVGAPAPDLEVKHAICGHAEIN